MSSSKKIVPLAQRVYRQVARNSSSEAYPVPPRYSQFRARQAKLEVPDETPIHIKGGFGDKMLVQATWGLVVIGTGMALETFYRIVVGKK